MSNYKIISFEDVMPDAGDVFRQYLDKLPQIPSLLELITHLYSVYEAKGIAHRFSIKMFNKSLHSHGLLVGKAAEIYVFWASSCGHFWIDKNAITFEHPYGLVTKSRAPIIEEGRIQTVYYLATTNGHTRAVPLSQNETKNQYKDELKQPSSVVFANADNIDETGAPAVRPNDGFTLIR